MSRERAGPVPGTGQMSPDPVPGKSLLISLLLLSSFLLFLHASCCDFSLESSIVEYCLSF